MSRSLLARIVLPIGAVLVAFLLSGPVAANHFDEKGKGGQQPAEDENPDKPDCKECPCPPPEDSTSGSQGCSTESNNVTTDPGAAAGEPVDAYTGRLYLTRSDLVVNGVVPIRMVRQYDSQSRYDSPLGYGWSFTYDVRLFEYPPVAPDTVGHAVVRGWEGRRWRYLPPVGASTEYVPKNANGGRIPILERDTVAGDAVEHVLTYDSGERALFDSEGRMFALETPEGNRLRFFYSATKEPLRGMSPYTIDPTAALTVAHVWRLTEIREQLRSQVGSSPEQFTGRFVQLSYDTQTGRITKIASHDGREVNYSHAETAAYPGGGAVLPAMRGNLASVVGAHTATESGIVETYRYPATPTAGSTPMAFEHIHNLTYQQDGAGAAAVLTEFEVATDRVVAQTFGSSSWVFGYQETPVIKRTIQRTIVTPGQSSQTATTEYEFNPQGFLTVKRDAEGNRIEYVRPTGHETSQVKVYEDGSVLSRTIDFTHKADGRLETRTVTLPETSETVTTTWDYEGRFTKLHQIVSSKDPDTVFKTVREYFLDSAGRPVNVSAIKRRKATESGSDVYVTTSMTYDPDHGQLVMVTPPDTGDHLAVRRLYYTAADDLPGASPPLIRNGLLKRIELIDASTLDPDPHLAREFDYDAAGKVVEITDAKGNVVDLAWDGRGRVTRVTRHVGASAATWESTLLRYGAPNLAGTSVPDLGTDPASDTATPGEHLLQVEVGALGATGTSTPGRVQRFVVDARGNVITVQRKDAGGSFVVRSYHVYDSDDNRVQSSEPIAGGDYRDVTFFYDTMKRVIKVRDDAGNDTLFEYDAMGNRTKVTEAITSQITNFVYDDLDRLAEIQVLGTDPDEITKFEYDAVGSVTKVTDPKSQETEYIHDALSRLVSIEQELGQATHYRYDDRDRLIRVVNARSPGPTLLRRYEFWGGLDEIEFYPTEADAITGTSPVRTISYEYDLEGNLVSASDDDTALGISGPLFTTSPVSGYDEHNRLRERTLHYVPTHDVTLTATYNQFGERTQLDITQDTETLTHSWTYDALGRLDEASFPGSGLMDFTPLPDDTIGTIERASGVITDRVYHARGPVDTITVTAPGSAQLLALDYTLNAVQNITGLDEQYWSTDPDEPYVFGYDGANRLASADYPAAYDLPADASYEYDPAGNRETFGTPGDYDYDANNRLTVSPLAALHCFDDDGNLVTKRTGVDCSTGTVTDTFTWDAQNRLRTFSNAGASAAYAYDPFGRRIKKAVGSTTTWYVWDGDQLLAEYDASGDRDVRYAYAGGFAPVQVAYESGSYAGVYDVHGDHLDTPRLLTDENGTPVWRASYEAFGEAHVSDDPDGLVMTPDPNIDFNVRFPGQYYDAETERWDPTLNGGAGDIVEGSGLHYNRFRTYDPAAGRYVSADPIGQTGGINVYRYVYANPLLLGDPLGLTCMTTYDCTLAKGGDNAKALADAAEAVVNTTTVIGFGVGGGLQTLDKSSEDCPPAREAERTKDGRGDVKAGDEISFEDAVDRVKGGEDVIAKDQETARDIAEAAGEGRPEWDPPHTDQAGPDARPHYHPTSGGERTGGHVFY